MQPVSPTVSCPFKWLYRRVPSPLGAKAELSNVRQGVMQVDPQGVVIQGKTAQNKDIAAGMRWEQMREILLAPVGQQVCFVYDVPNYAGKLISFSLAFTPAPGYYEMVAHAVRQYAPVPVEEGRLKNATKPIAWVMLVLVLVLFAAIMVINQKEGYSPTLH